MKKIILALLIAIISLQLFGCASDDAEKEETPVYAEVYTVNDDYHWRAQLNGTGRTDYAEHENYKGKCVCGKYYDSSEVLTYRKVTILGEEGLEVSAYDKTSSVIHVEIPAYHEFNGETLPVLQIGGSCFADSALKSIKLNEGLIYINKQAFRNTFIEEIVIPNSVKGSNPLDYLKSGGLYNTFGGCSNLKRVVMGNGIEVLGGYVFSSCKNLSEITLSSNLSQIGNRDFYECKELKEIVIPSTLIYMPESEIYAPAVEKIVTLNVKFNYARSIYLNITKQDLIDLTVPLYNRDIVTGEKIPDNIQRNPGYCEGWAGFADLYYLGEWIYDENGKPKPII
ncbi:MAG: leucine-rich repeat domain-containing protein [Clostridia bacterium]|nr:leucine-rich repeat domain-containing protein [Clostridia bacterium]